MIDALVNYISRRRNFVLAAVVGGAFLLALILAVLSAQKVTDQMTPGELEALRQQIRRGEAQQPGTTEEGTVSQGTGAQTTTGQQPAGQGSVDAGIQPGTGTTSQSGESRTGGTEVDPLTGATLVPSTRISFDSYKLEASIPTLPKTVNVYHFKTNYTRGDAMKLARQIGMNADDIKDEGPMVKVFDNSDTDTNGVLIFDKRTGYFSFLSGGVHRPSSPSQNPVLTAQNFLSDIGRLDDTVRCIKAYKRESTPNVEYVECHRDWGAVGHPILNALSTLNLSLKHRLSDLSVGRVVDALLDVDIYDASDGTDGMQTANDFNTITVAIATTDNSVLSATSSIPEIDSVEAQTAPGELMSPSEALAQLKSGQSVYSFAIPSGEGYVDITKLLPSSSVLGKNASVRDFVIAYLGANPGTVQDRLSPYYLFRGKAQLSGYDVDFVEAVPVLRGSLGGPEVLGQQSPSSGLETKTSNEESAASLQYKSIEFALPETPPTELPPAGNCPIKFTNCATVTGGKVCWFPSTYKESKEKCRTVTSGTKKGKKICGRVGRSWWWLPDGSEPMTLSKTSLRGKRGDAIKSCSPPKKDTCPAASDAASGRQCYHIITMSPSVYAYSLGSVLGASVRVNPVGDLTYVNPDFSSLSGKQWNFQTSADGILSFADGEVGSRMYYEYNGANILSRIKKYHEGRPAFIVERDALEHFLTSYLFGKLGLNAQERADLLAEVEREVRGLARQSGGLDAELVRVALVDKFVLDEYLPISVSPSPSNLYRIHLLITPAGKNLKVAPPNLSRIVRDGFTVVETGVIVGF